MINVTELLHHRSWDSDNMHNPLTILFNKTIIVSSFMARVSVSFNNVVIVTGSLAIEESHPYVGKYS